MPEKVNLHIHFSDPRTWEAALICAHCRIPHRATKEEVERYTKSAEKHHVSIDQIWECGKCFLAHLEFETGEKVSNLKTLCTHEVPPFSKTEGGIKQ